MPAEKWPFEILFNTKNKKRMYAVTKNGMRKGFPEKNLDSSVPIEERFAGYVGRSDNGGELWSEIVQVQN